MKTRVDMVVPMPLTEFPSGQIPKHLVHRPETDALLEQWEERRGNRLMPARRDFALESVKRWAPQLSIVQCLEDGRLRFVLFGTELAQVYGQDLTDGILCDLPPVDLWSVIVLHYRDVISTRMPLFCPISICNGRWYTEVSRLLLPLSEDGERVDFVLGADYSRRPGDFERLKRTRERPAA